MVAFLLFMYIANIVTIVVAIVLLQVEFVLEGNRKITKCNEQRNFCIIFLAHLIVNLLITIIQTFFEIGFAMFIVTIIYNITFPLVYYCFTRMLFSDRKNVRTVMFCAGLIFAVTWSLIDIVAYNGIQAGANIQVAIAAIDGLFFLVIAALFIYWIVERKKKMEEPETRTMGLICIFMGIYSLFCFYYDITAYIPYYFTKSMLIAAYLYQCSLFLFFIIGILLSYYAGTNINKYKLLSSVAYKMMEENSDDMIDKAGLSKREQEVLELTLEGMSNPLIAEKLFITPSTVKKHLGSIYKKTGLNNRYELIAFFKGTDKQNN